MFLHKANEAGVITSYIDSRSASKAQPGFIQQTSLKTGDYVIVVKLKSRNSKYLLRLFNNTNLAENVGYLENEKKYPSQTLALSIQKDTITLN
jgi:hypothetical protein